MKQSFFSRVVKFIRSYVRHDPLFVLTYAVVFFYPKLIFRPKFYTTKTLQAELIKGRSLIRLGDGEIHLINGGSIGFQKYELGIANVLKQGITHYSDFSPYIICINERVMDKSNAYLRQVNQLYLWLPTKVYYWLYFNKAATYFDASAFYYKHSFDKILSDYLSTKKLVLVAKEQTVQNFQRNYPGSADIIETIITKSENAFDDHEAIIETLKKYTGDNVVVLLACGPAGKYLTHQLASQLQCLDIGHGLEIAYTDNDLEKLLII